MPSIRRRRPAYLIAPAELTEAIELFAFLEDEYAAILDRWKKRQRKT